jgi:hypothetical protein
VRSPPLVSFFCPAFSTFFILLLFFIFLLASIPTLLFLLLDLARDSFNRIGVWVSAPHGKEKWRTGIIYMLPGADNSDLVR